MVRRPEPIDRSKVKLSSFRITEGEWFDFCEECDRQNITATDVIKGAIQLFMDGLLELPDLNYVRTAVNTSASVDGSEIQTLIDSGIEQALAPIREKLSNARVGTHTDLTADGVQTAIDAAIERAIAPISIDLAELLRQVDELRGSVNGKSQSKSRTSATTTEEPHPEVIKLANRLKADPDGLQMSVRAGIAEGLGGKALCEFLFEYGHGANNGSKPFDSSVAGRFVKAIAYLDSEGT
jgi:hypothetical protein